MKKILAVFVFSLMGFLFADTSYEYIQKTMKTFIHKGEYVEIVAEDESYIYPKSSINLYYLFNGENIGFIIYAETGKEIITINKWNIKGDENGNVILTKKENFDEGK